MKTVAGTQCFSLMSVVAATMKAPVTKPVNQPSRTYSFMIAPRRKWHPIMSMVWPGGNTPQVRTDRCGRLWISGLRRGSPDTRGRPDIASIDARLSPERLPRHGDLSNERGWSRLGRIVRKETSGTPVGVSNMVPESGAETTAAMMNRMWMVQAQREVENPRAALEKGQGIATADIDGSIPPLFGRHGPTSRAPDVPQDTGTLTGQREPLETKGAKIFGPRSVWVMLHELFRTEPFLAVKAIGDGRTVTHGRPASEVDFKARHRVKLLRTWSHTPGPGPGQIIPVARASSGQSQQ